MVSVLKTFRLSSQRESRSQIIAFCQVHSDSRRDDLEVGHCASGVTPLRGLSVFGKDVLLLIVDIDRENLPEVPSSRRSWSAKFAFFPLCKSVVSDQEGYHRSLPIGHSQVLDVYAQKVGTGALDYKGPGSSASAGD
jgi:hypothetical protein